MSQRHRIAPRVLQRNLHKREISFKIQSKSVQKSQNQIQDIIIVITYHFEVMYASFAKDTFRGMVDGWNS